MRFVKAYTISVMTSFNYYTITPTHGNCFQTNQPEHESDDHAGNTITSVCNHWERYGTSAANWSTFVNVLWSSKTKITDGIGILVLVRVLSDTVSKIYRQLWHNFFKNTLENLLQFLSHWNDMEKNGTSVCLTPVSMATWCLHILWCFTVPVFWTHDHKVVDSIALSDPFVESLSKTLYLPCSFPSICMLGDTQTG